MHTVKDYWSGALQHRRLNVRQLFFGNDSLVGASVKPDLIPFETCKRIWAHVLLNALRDCNKVSYCVSAKAWIFSRRTGVGSLRWICDHLDLDYDEIQMLAMTREGRAQLLGREY
jgi:hypothetical protein